MRKKKDKGIQICPKYNPIPLAIILAIVCLTLFGIAQIFGNGEITSCYEAQAATNEVLKWEYGKDPATGIWTYIMTDTETGKEYIVIINKTHGGVGIIERGEHQ